MRCLQNIIYLNLLSILQISTSRFMRIPFYYFLLLTSILVSSCSSIYIPNVPNTPMLTKAGELHASGHISLKGNVSVNSAYALGDHLGVLFGGSLMNSNTSKKDFKQNLIEMGTGYFTTFGADNKRILEVYAGYGKGNSDLVFKDRTLNGPVVTETQKTSFDKYFMQVNYSSKDKKNLKLFKHNFPLNYGTALRVSYANMNNFQLNGVAHQTEDNIFLEPVFYTRMRLNNIWQLQYTSGSNFGLKNRKYLTAGYSVFTLGVIVNVGGK